jgi:hypothetical protein
MDDRRRIVEAGYEALALDYAALEQPGHEWPRLRLLRAALERVPPGSTVLDLGCGNGLPALAEIARGSRRAACFYSASNPANSHRLWRSGSASRCSSAILTPRPPSALWRKKTSRL